jgi:myosin heavy subunit
MDERDIRKLEKEREKLEKARERLEEERQRLEDERQEMEDARQELEDERERLRDEMEDMKENARDQARERLDEQREMLREKAEALTEEQRGKLESMAAKIEKAMESVQEQLENSIAGIDFDALGENLHKGMREMEKGFKDMEKDIRISVENDMKNVGILNLKDITAEELDKMGDIRNMGVIIVPEELMGKISSRVLKNMGTIVPYKKGWRIYSGHTEVDKAMLESLEEPIEFIHTGYLSIAKDVTAGLIKAKVKAFHNYGHISATDETYGILMSKCIENYGEITRNGDDENYDVEIPNPPKTPKPPRAPQGDDE